MPLQNRLNELSLPFYTLGTLRQRIGWFVNLRWIAIFAILISIPIGQKVFNFNLAYSQLYIIAALLLTLNLIYFFLYKYFPFKSFLQELSFTEIQMIADLIIISFIVHYAGGIENPFFFLYIVHIIISGILFQGILPYINTIISAVLLTIWSILECYGYVEIYMINGKLISFPMMITSLLAFYILIFTATYVIIDFIKGYRLMKHVIDEKSRLLEKTMEERDKMFRFTAHELKSPLTTIRSILSVIKILYAEGRHQEVKDMINRAEKRSDQVLFMVKDMIEIGQYKHGTKEKKLESVPYEKWLTKVVEQQRMYAQGKQIDLQVVALKSNSRVILDPASMDKVLSNLLSNAIRYSLEQTSVTVRPFIKKNSFGFSVADMGIGIPKEEQEKIFEEFYRSKNARLMEQLGTGLGLSLVKQIIDEYQGKISIRSEPGKGSEFTVEFPKQYSENRITGS